MESSLIWNDSMDERFWSKVAVTCLDECWPWLASLKDGYGQFQVGTFRKPKVVRAHRVAYVLLIGPILEGLTLDHLCRNRASCNPWHLEPVTRGENVLRGISPPAINARKTHCLRGHVLAGRNLRHTATGGRRCRTCDRRRAVAAST